MIEQSGRGGEMTENSTDELSEIRAERDALRRELGDLRAHLCVALRLLHRGPGPQGITVLSVASDREIVEAVRRLVTNATPASSEAQHR
ncbi:MULTISPECIES: hypothetical protein [Pseudofrankia]|uniref:hypothetical protein n=1 Tax=Pseudofrankia TaxID=2994363 RepID=UPI0002D34AC5|nr:MULTISPECIES: hypothetical protein [Pseudofrankia]OHV41505.1 hypothetical protein BCD49_00655 [Pseudofrankia sp. EUN1h]